MNSLIFNLLVALYLYNKNYVKIIYICWGFILNLEGIRGLFKSGGVSAVFKGYHIGTPTEQKTQMIGLKNLSLIARLFIYIKEKCTHKNPRPFSQIRYKLDLEALDNMDTVSKVNFCSYINQKRINAPKIIVCLDSLKDYKIFIKKIPPHQFAQTHQQQIANMHIKPS